MKHSTSSLTLLVGALLLFGTALYGQSKDKKAGQQSLEFPIVVVQGLDKFDVPAVIKKSPGKTPAVSRQRLDSLNPLEKQRPSLLPAAGLPEPERTPKFADGFIEGQAGQFLSADITGGFGFTAGNYRLYADGNLSGSGGHLENAEYLRYGAGLSAVYVAPEQFIFFGGSRTESAIRFGQQHYTLFSIPQPPERSTTHFSFGADISGAYDGYSYSAGGSWSRRAITQAGIDAADNGLSGSLNVARKFDGYTLGADVVLDFHTLRGTGYNLMQFSGQYKALVSGAAVEAEAGLQAAAGTNESSSAAFRAAGKIRVPLSQDYSLGATLFTGLEPVTFGEYLERNPYFSTRSGIAYSHALIAVGGMIHYHPAPSFSGIAGVRFVLRDNAQYFHYDTLGMFAVSPGNTSQAEAQAEFAWKPDVGNVLSSNITVVSAKFSDTSGTVPYLPALRVAAEWSAIWSRRIGTRITATWVGSQYVQRGIQRELDGFFTLGIRGDYTLQHDISFFVRLDNITNSTVMIWDGYSERGIYASAGVLWKF